MTHPTILSFASSKEKSQTWSSRIERSPREFITKDVKGAHQPKYESSFSDLTCESDAAFLDLPDSWFDKEYREAVVEAGIEQDIAWQIRNNRQLRNWTQKDLSERLATQQSAVQRLEDPNYGSHSLRTLVKVAHAFDCALQVRLLPFSKYAELTKDLSPEATYAASFIEEFADGHKKNIQQND